MRTLALDARETAFFREQLTQIQAEVYRETYAELKALKILFADTSISDAVDNYEWRKYSEVGSAKIVSNYATDFPRVDIYGSSEGTKIRSLGTSYGYSVQEIRAAARNGIALESERARVARAAIEKKIDDILWFGDATHGLLGFLNFPGMSEYAIPAGASASRAWTSKTPDEILRDVRYLRYAVRSATGEAESPNTLLLPPLAYEHIAGTRMSTNSDTTILTFLRGNIPEITMIDTLDSLGNFEGSSRVIMFDRNRSKVRAALPLPFEQFETQVEGMAYVVPCHARCGGIIYPFPMSAVYGTGI